MSDTLERLREEVDRGIYGSAAADMRALLDIAEAAQTLVEANRHSHTGHPALVHARLSETLASLDSTGGAER